MPLMLWLSAQPTGLASGTLVLLKVVDGLLGLRVSQAAEVEGLDLSQHEEEGYIFA